LALDRFSRAPTPPAVAVPAPPPSLAPPEPTPPPLPKTVVLHVETEPAGAEIRQGSRVFGVAPRDVLLPRSDVPARLTFHLDGYEDGATQVVPSTDDSIRVKLTTRPRARRTKPAVNGPAKTAPAQSALPAGETLPNPY
jgi:hypothetical protein